MKLIPVEGPYGTYVLPEGDHQTKVWQEAGHYEKAYVEMMVNRLADDSVAVDVGASFGAHAVPYARRCRKVYAFEPDPVSAKILQQNAKTNHVDCIKLFNVAVGRKSGRARSPGHGPNNRGAHKLILHEGPKATIPVIALDELTKLELCDVMKVDVEGMELDVLAGAKEYISYSMPFLFIECSSNCGAILEYLVQDLGYQSFRKHGKNIYASARNMKESFE